jgi:type IV secretion system protein VirB10
VVNEPEQTHSAQDGEPVAALRLRSERPAVMRLSRKVLTGLVGVAAITVSAAALIWALYQGNRKTGGGPELYNTENKTTPDGLSALPRDYAGVAPPPAGSGIPPLGPPLPGDIGRPVPGAQATGPGAVDPEQQRIAQEAEAARTSRLFATTSTREQPAAAAPVAPSADQKTATPAGQTDVPPLDPESLLNMQDRKAAFLNRPVEGAHLLPASALPWNGGVEGIKNAGSALPMGVGSKYTFPSLAVVMAKLRPPMGGRIIGLDPPKSSSLSFNCLIFGG